MLRRMPVLALSLALLVSAAAPAFARELFSREDGAVRELVDLYAQASRIFPVSRFPMSRKELAAVADRLAEAVPSLSDKIQDYEGRYLSGDKGALGIEGSIGAAYDQSLESRKFSFDGAPFYRSLDTAKNFRFADPFASTGGALSIGGKAEIALRADIMRRFNSDPASSTNWFSSDPGTPIGIENDFVQEGYLWYDFDPLTLQFGRASANMGSMRDSLEVSDRIPYLDELRLILPMGPASIDLIVASLETRASKEEIAELPVFDIPSDAGLIARNEIRSMSLLSVHRFEWAFPRARFALSEQYVVSRRNNSYSLGDFFPVFNWHQSDLTPNNVTIYLDADVALFQDARIMCQFGLDDFNAGTVGIGDDSTPTIPAGMLAFEYSPEIAGTKADFYLEGGATHYLWGNYDNYGVSNGTTDVYSYLARNIYRWRLYVDGDTIDMPLTSPYGPGAEWAKLEVSTGTLWGVVKPKLTILLLSMNDLANLVTTKYVNDPAVSNAPRTDTLAVGITMDAHFLKYCSASVAPALYFQGGNVTSELTFSLRIGAKGSAALR